MQTFAQGMPPEEFDSAQYSSHWEVIPFGPAGPLDAPDDAEADSPPPSSVDIRDGLIVLMRFGYLHTSLTGDAAEDGDSLDKESYDGLQINAVFLIDYQARPERQQKLIDEPLEVDVEDVRAFAEYNSTFNAWPYWREFVQSMCARMGLPQVVVPVLPVPALFGLTKGSQKSV
jgi:hypothetical protein